LVNFFFFKYIKKNVLTHTIFSLKQRINIKIILKIVLINFILNDFSVASVLRIYYLRLHKTLYQEKGRYIYLYECMHIHSYLEQILGHLGLE
jgi:hypothetical protein